MYVSFLFYMRFEPKKNKCFSFFFPIRKKNCYIVEFRIWEHWIFFFVLTISSPFSIFFLVETAHKWRALASKYIYDCVGCCDGCLRVAEGSGVGGCGEDVQTWTWQQKNLNNSFLLKRKKKYSISARIQPNDEYGENSCVASIASWRIHLRCIHKKSMHGFDRSDCDWLLVKLWMIFEWCCDCCWCCRCGSACDCVVGEWRLWPITPAPPPPPPLTPPPCPWCEWCCFWRRW